MSRPQRRQIYQPQPQYASVAQQSPSRGNSISYAHQQQGPWGQPIPQPQFQHQAQRVPVPQPQPQIGGPRPVRSSSASSQNRRQQQQHGRHVTAMGVATGNIGAGYGPYSVRCALSVFWISTNFLVVSCRAGQRRGCLWNEHTV
jgi:hypothetical protein